jgi:hypothetical protein
MHQSDKRPLTTGSHNKVLSTMSDEQDASGPHSESFDDADADCNEENNVGDSNKQDGLEQDDAKEDHSHHRQTDELHEQEDNDGTEASALQQDSNDKNPESTSFDSNDMAADLLVELGNKSDPHSDYLDSLLQTVNYDNHGATIAEDNQQEQLQDMSDERYDDSVVDSQEEEASNSNESSNDYGTEDSEQQERTETSAMQQGDSLQHSRNEHATSYSNGSNFIKNPPARRERDDDDVIELSDSDSGDEETVVRHNKVPNPLKPSVREISTEHKTKPIVRREDPPVVNKAVPIQPGQSLIADGYPAGLGLLYSASSGNTSRMPHPMSSSYSYGSSHSNEEPVYFSYPADFSPTWDQMLPSVASMPAAQSPASTYDGPKRYQLSLLNVNEFTIEGLSTHQTDLHKTSIAGLRKVIKKIARDHGGTAVFQRDVDDKDGGANGNSNGGAGEGRWRIPISAYQSFYSFLVSDPKATVIGIPEHQLKIASLERARQERGYPTDEQLIRYGVPPGLARALAPFQRGGVDFVREKDGKALIADGKCNQCV